MEMSDCDNVGDKAIGVLFECAVQKCRKGGGLNNLETRAGIITGRCLSLVLFIPGPPFPVHHPKLEKRPHPLD